VIIGLMLTTFGSVVLPIVGWLVGIVLICASDLVRRGHKVLAIMVFPLGMLPALQVASVPLDTSGTPSYCRDQRFLSPAPSPCDVHVVGATQWARVLQWAFILLSAVGPLVVAWVIGRDLGRSRDR
jgi:hypothetical protein